MTVEEVENPVPLGRSRRWGRRGLALGIVLGLVAFGAIGAVPAASHAIVEANALAPSLIRETANTRVSGGDRYATAAEVSKRTYPGTASAVFIASGADYPDALSATALTAKLKAPLLLTRPSDLPASTAAELERLKPGRIVVVGGTGVVSAEVEAALKQYAPTVERIAGADRYATAAAVAKSGWTSSSEVFVASGLGYADALSAGAAAARIGAPVLLVPGDQQVVPQSVAAALDALKPSALRIAGGTGAVSGALESALKRGTVTSVTRYAGGDRFETSALIARGVFRTGAADVYWANGGDFPDALAGASAAGARSGALILVRPTCVPSVSYAATKRLVPGATTILGGPGALDDGVLHGNECATQPSDVSAADWGTASSLYTKINAERFKRGLGGLRLGTPGQRAAAQSWAGSNLASPKLNPTLRSSQPAVRYQAVASTGAADRPGRLLQLFAGEAGTRVWLDLPNGGSSNAVSIGVASGSGKSTAVLYFSVRTD